jgi:hypothetical protein
MDMKEIGSLIKTQDNRITDQPMFLVQREVVDYGYNSDYSDTYNWINAEDDYLVATEEESSRLDGLYDSGEDTEGYEKVYYVKRWEFVTACFTEQGCKDHISANGHNLGKTRIYADGSYRNFEFRAIRNFLIKAA